MEEQETMGKGGGGTNNEMLWHTSLGWAKKIEDVKKELDEEDLFRRLDDDCLASKKGRCFLCPVQLDW